MEFSIKLGNNGLCNAPFNVALDTRNFFPLIIKVDIIMKFCMEMMTTAVFIALKAGSLQTDQI